MGFFQTKKGFITLGIISGVLFSVLAYMGNPPNMALCAACFIRDMTGALKLHSAAAVQYFRPEIVGIILGAFAMSAKNKEFISLKGTAVPVRFALGFIMMLCALVFLGCPLRMILRIGDGDMSGFVGLGGFLIGIAVGTFFLKKGFYLGEATEERKSVGYGLPIIIAVLFVIGVGTTLYSVSKSGPGSMHAPILISLAVGLVFGAIAQKTKMCFSGAFREAMFYNSFWRILPIISILAVVVVYNLVMGTFHVAAYGPIAHDNTLWNVLSMIGVGLAATLAGGCPLRHLVLGGSGSTDSVVTILGMVAGAAAAHNFNMAAAPSTIKAGQYVMGGPAFYGQVGVVVSLIVLLAIGVWGCKAYGLVRVQETEEV